MGKCKMVIDKSSLTLPALKKVFLRVLAVRMFYVFKNFYRKDAKSAKQQSPSLLVFLGGENG
jgi:hypothetical protein